MTAPTTARHTPGPWKLTPRPIGGGQYVWGNGSRPIAILPGEEADAADGVPIGTAAATARLLAAAPALYAALAELLADVCRPQQDQRPDVTIPAARAALAAARGE